MYPSGWYGLFLLAEARVRENLEWANRRRVLQEVNRARARRPRLWDRSLWRAGDLLIALGAMLKGRAGTSIDGCREGVGHAQARGG
jgi:hypothetical protein